MGLACGRAGEELPDGFAGVELAAGPADESLREVLLAAGPGVSAALHGIEDHTGAARAGVAGWTCTTVL